MNEIMNISGIECFEKDGVAYLRLETVARGLGFTTVAASGNEVVRWNTVHKYLESLGVATSCNGSNYQESCPEFIPENIFYRLAMKAKNEVAEHFQAKIADEVIPSIRKHGAYMTPQTLEKAILNPDTMIQLCTMLKEEQEKRRKIESENQKLAIENEDMKPKAEFYDTVTDSKDAISMAEVAKVLDYDIGRNKLFELLKKKKILDKSRVPYQRFVDAGYFRVIETKYTKPNGDVCINIKTLVLQRGIDYIRKVLNEEGRKPRNKDGNRKEKHYESRD